MFSFGIGLGVSRGLVSGVARVGNGKAVFIEGGSSGDLTKVVKTQLQRWEEGETERQKDGGSLREIPMESYVVGERGGGG